MRIAVAGGTGVVGRYVVEAAEAAGHEVVVLSRSRGVDLRSGEGLQAALDGVEAIVEVTNAGTIEREAATAFFTEVSGRLQAVGAARGVGHIVTLSIVGIERAPESPYYAAKLRQEEVALAGPVPATVLRATQFHEFPVQVMRRGTLDSTAYVPSSRVQTVAARTVGRRLVELAVSPAVGMAQDLAGPEERDLLELAQAFVRRYDLQIAVLAAPANPTVPPGANLPTADARLDGPTFEAWLETEDAARMARGQ
ncbi:MAG: NAD-dependent epimerase/dehydratase family protein [Chloroflexi bacterium]|nr:NAD-dependent epimerase/dehydratase family protein [Chloroflexota bacterium]